MEPFDPEVLSATRHALSEDFGGLSDLPAELQNTIANLYYEFFRPGPIFHEDGTLINPGDEPREFVDRAAYLVFCRRTLPSTIATLRRLRAQSQSRYEVAVTVLLAKYKYRIANPMRKPVFWLRLQMLVKAPKVDKVPDLLISLDLPPAARDEIGHGGAQRSQAAARHGTSPVDSQTAVEWLKNIYDAFASTTQEEDIISEHTARRLAILSEMEALAGTASALDVVPRSVKILPGIMIEFRLYCDCLWQLYLLDKTPNHEKVSFLSASVLHAQESLWRAVFKENPRIEKLLTKAIHGIGAGQFRDAAARYISGQHTETEQRMLNALRPSGQDPNPLVENATILATRLSAIFEHEGIDLEEGDYERLVSCCWTVTEEAWKNELLVQFDLERCEVIELPPDFYEG